MSLVTRLTVAFIADSPGGVWCTQTGEAIIGLPTELAVDCTTELTGDMLT